MVENARPAAAQLFAEVVENGFAMRYASADEVAKPRPALLHAVAEDVAQPRPSVDQ